MSDIVGQLKGKPLFYYVAETKKITHKTVKHYESQL